MNEEENINQSTDDGQPSKEENKTVSESSNKERLKTFLEKLNDYSFYTQAIINKQVILSNSVKNTLDVLKKEYHLENE